MAKRKYKIIVNGKEQEISLNIPKKPHGSLVAKDGKWYWQGWEYKTIKIDLNGGEEWK